MHFQVVFKRILTTIPTLFALIFLIFILLKCIPGDAARLLLGEKASQEALEEVREEYGLNKPIPVQFMIYVQKIVTKGDFGTSIRSGDTVASIIKEKFPATFELAFMAIILACLIGVPLGALAALSRGGIFDFLMMGSAVTGVSIPVFWLGLVLMWFFGLELGWLPLSGRLDIVYDYQPVTGFLLLDSLIQKNWAMFADALKHLVLPTITLSTIPMAFIARMTRSSLLDSLQMDYIRTARAKGAGKLKVYFYHALKNASVPIINITGLQFGTLMAGAMITETIFSWPGMGRFILESVHSRDIPALEGGLIVIATTFVIINLLVDVSFTLIDKRIKIS